MQIEADVGENKAESNISLNLHNKLIECQARFCPTEMFYYAESTNNHQKNLAAQTLRVFDFIHCIQQVDCVVYDDIYN